MKSIIEFYIIRRIKKYAHILQSVTQSIKLKNPAKDLKIIAVTGTSGKSSTSTMIYHVLKAAGFKVGLISTVEAVAGDKVIDTGLHVTTPDAKDLQKILFNMKKEGIQYVVLESSSHAIDQGRLGLLKIDFAVFTNIKRDHLDWHKTWENYARAKAGLIKKLKKDGIAVVNIDDHNSYNFLRSYYYSLTKNPLKFIEYSKEKEALNSKESMDGLEFIYKNTKFSIPILGEYNIDNALATIKVAENLGIEVNNISKFFSSFKGLKGRMEIMQKNPFLIIVDFAHNADSLQKSLKSIRDLKGINRVISVFGSAGLRDTEKRYTMGTIAAELSDIVVVTSEDPRTESLFNINSQIIEGAKKGGGKLIKRFVNTDAYKEFLESRTEIINKSIFAFDQESVLSRFDAIAFAIRIARPGDVVITEGKGHEKSLCFGIIEYPFTDQQAVEEALTK